MLTHFRLRMAAVAMIMVGGFSSMFCSASSFYSCTDGTLDPENFSSNNCAAFFSSNCHKIDTQEKCDDKDACQWDAGECKRVKDITAPETPHGIDARYVKLYHDISGNVINISELQIYDYGGDTLTSNISNVVGYSSQHETHLWTRILDSNVTTFGHSASDATGDQHVTVDLGSNKKVYKVVVENRRDCCKDRIVGARVELSTSQSTPIISSPRITGVSNTYTYIFDTTSSGWSSSST